MLLKSYLNDRKQYVLIDNQKSSEKIIEYGIPQGSILGPLLFLIYVNDLPSCLETVPRFFADDTARLIDCNNTTELQTLTNTELAKINQWMTANNLVVNANKTISLNISPTCVIIMIPILCLEWRNCMLFKFRKILRNYH